VLSQALATAFLQNHNKIIAIFIKDSGRIGAGAEKLYSRQ
jgi:hypothetical protein